MYLAIVQDYLHQCLYHFVLIFVLNLTYLVLNLLLYRLIQMCYDYCIFNISIILSITVFILYSFDIFNFQLYDLFLLISLNIAVLIPIIMLFL
jgi:hypothetical protein